MITIVGSGPARCALVVGGDDTVDGTLLDAIAARTGSTFTLLGSGGFGGGPLATVYADESGDLLIETVEPDIGVRAMLVRTESAERAVAIRAVIGERCRVWTEQALRAQGAAALTDQAWILVPMMMAVGGAQPDPETFDLLQRALRHDDETVREAARYAEDVAKELVHDPAVVRDTAESELDDVLTPAGPVEGEERWVTVRPGVPGRAVPRPVTWLRLSPDASHAVYDCAWEQNWTIEVAGSTNVAWFEEIWVTGDGRTAVHEVAHPALPGGYVAVHGEDARDVAAVLREAGAEPIDGPPSGLDRAAP